MIYLHVTVKVRRGKLEEWTRIFEDHLLPIQKKHGQRLVGAWKTTVGAYDEVTDLYAFESLAEFEEIREKLFGDPDLKQWLAAICELIDDEHSKILTPLGYGELT
jgi:hypothetical protein